MKLLTVQIYIPVCIENVFFFLTINHFKLGLKAPMTIFSHWQGQQSHSENNEKLSTFSREDNVHISTYMQVLIFLMIVYLS